MLLGYVVIEFTSEFHSLWQDRSDFLENLITLFLHGAVSPLESPDPSVQMYKADFSDVETKPEKVVDLPADLVHLILQRAKKLGKQEYALMYVLFGAGLSPAEIVKLERSHYISEAHQQLLRVVQRHDRRVPINQWIMGKRYGSYTRNPLTAWLKSRKDKEIALFLDSAKKPLSELELRQQWQTWTEGLQTPEGQSIAIEQAQQTWCIDMLTRGMSPESLCILTDWDIAKLQPYIDRTQEKAALEQAVSLDQKV
jgi:site-specific recombinase XerD